MADDQTETAVPASSAYAAGQVIADKYRLERLLGEGGQACVWEATNLMLDANVAIKVVRSGVRDPAHARRLLQEARTAARLDHPAIVRVFDLGQTTAGDQFLVMELLEGDALADHLHVRERLPPVDAVRILLPIAEALALAHSKGLVHRDVKPDNVLLARSSGALQPKLLDFGVVKRQDGGKPSAELTETGAIVGTPAYFSPEQAAGKEELDERADIWGYAAMLYECITGELPFKGANYNALLRSILEDTPRSLLEYGVDDVELWSIVERGLRKPPQERWPTMLAMGRALAEWLLRRGVVDDISRTSLRSKWLSPASGALPWETAAAPSETGAGYALSNRERLFTSSHSERQAFVSEEAASVRASAAWARRRRARVLLAAAAAALATAGVALFFVGLKRRPPLEAADARERTLVVGSVARINGARAVTSAQWDATEAQPSADHAPSPRPSVSAPARTSSERGESRPLRARPSAAGAVPPARPSAAAAPRREAPSSSPAREAPQASGTDSEFDLLAPY